MSCIDKHELCVVFFLKNDSVAFFSFSPQQTQTEHTGSSGGRSTKIISSSEHISTTVQSKEQKL